MITRASNGTVLEPGLDRKGLCMTTTTPCAHLSVLFLDLIHYSGLSDQLQFMRAFITSPTW